MADETVLSYAYKYVGNVDEPSKSKEVRESFVVTFSGQSGEIRSLGVHELVFFARSLN